MSVGVLGLIDAATRYKPTLGVPFDAFARRRVQGAMLDSLRDLDWAPRSLRRLRRDVDAADRLRAPPARPRAGGSRNRRRDGAVARRLREGARAAAHAGHRRRALARRASTRTARRHSSCASTRARARRRSSSARSCAQHLAQAIEQLPERERQILALYFEEELTLAEIGEVIGVGESRVSQLRSLALSRLRTLLRESLGLRGGAARERTSRRTRSTRCCVGRRPAATATRGRRSAVDAMRRRYNFRRPDRVSKEQLRSLHFLHDRFALNLSTSLSAFLRAMTEVSIVSVEQFAYSEFLMSLPDPTAFYAVAMPPLDGVGALELNPSVAFTMVDRMLGGTGQTPAPNRALTEIEQNVLDSVVKLLLEHLTEDVARRSPSCSSASRAARRGRRCCRSPGRTKS